MSRTYRRKNKECPYYKLNPNNLEIRDGELYEKAYAYNRRAAWYNISKDKLVRDLVAAGVEDTYEIAYQHNYKQAVDYHSDKKSGTFNAPRFVRNWLIRQNRRQWKQHFIRNWKNFDEEEIVLLKPKRDANWIYF